jgi:hypothetical protein
MLKTNADRLAARKEARMAPEKNIRTSLTYFETDPYQSHRSWRGSPAATTCS